MKNAILVLALFFISRNCIGQNIIFNGGFENYSQLPFAVGQYSFCNGWSNCNGFGSPDYFHLNGMGQAKLPNSFVSFLAPHSGSAVMGISLYSSTHKNYREYLSTTLINPLTTGQTYQLSFYISNGNRPFFYGGMTSDHFSVALSTIKLKQSSSSKSNLIIDFKPQLKFNGYLYSNNWQMVNFSFTADSSYQFLTFGCFDTIQQVQFRDSAQISSAYYFIDNISLQVLTNVDESHGFESSIIVFPKPFSNMLNIKTRKDDDYEIIIYDINSRMVICQKFTNIILINTEHLPNGIYLYEVKNRSKLIKAGKILKG